MLIVDLNPGPSEEISHPENVPTSESPARELHDEPVSGTDQMSPAQSQSGTAAEESAGHEIPTEFESSGNEEGPESAPAQNFAQTEEVPAAGESDPVAHHSEGQIPSNDAMPQESSTENVPTESSTTEPSRELQSEEGDTETKSGSPELGQDSKAEESIPDTTQSHASPMPDHEAESSSAPEHVNDTQATTPTHDVGEGAESNEPRGADDSPMHQEIDETARGNDNILGSEGESMEERPAQSHGNDIEREPEEPGVSDITGQEMSKAVQEPVGESPREAHETEERPEIGPDSTQTPAERSSEPEAVGQESQLDSDVPRDDPAAAEQDPVSRPQNEVSDAAQNESHASTEQPSSGHEDHGENADFDPDDSAIAMSPEESGIHEDKLDDGESQRSDGDLLSDPNAADEGHNHHPESAGPAAEDTGRIGEQSSHIPEDHGAAGSENDGHDGQDVSAAPETREGLATHAPESENGENLHSERSSPESAHPENDSHVQHGDSSLDGNDVTASDQKEVPRESLGENDSVHEEGQPRTEADDSEPISQDDSSHGDNGPVSTDAELSQDPAAHQSPMAGEPDSGELHEDIPQSESKRDDEGYSETPVADGESASETIHDEPAS